MEAKFITPGDIVSIGGRTVVVHSVDWEEGDATVLVRDASNGEKHSLWAGELVTVYQGDNLSDDLP